jgi:hypothetical protein
MKYIIISCLFLGVIFLGYPLLNEGATNECSAIETKVLHLALDQTSPDTIEQELLVRGVGELALQISNGAFTRSMVHDRYPNLPPQIGCAVSYWSLLGKPASLYEAMRNEYRASPSTSTVAKEFSQKTYIPPSPLPATPTTAPATIEQPASAKTGGCQTQTRIGCCPIGSTTKSLPGTSGRWLGWRASPLPASSSSALPPALNIEPATLAGTRARDGGPSRDRTCQIRQGR